MKEQPISEELRLKYYTVNADNTQLRILSGNGQEIVEYRPNTAVRIWYNDLTTSYDTHWHTSIEIIEPVENWYDVTIGESTYRVMPGEALIVPPRSLHSIQSPDTGSRFVYMLDMTSISGIHGFASIEPVIGEPILLNRTDYSYIYDDIMALIKKMRDEYFDQKQFAELSIYSHLLELLVTLGTHRFESLNIFDGMRVYKQKEYTNKFNDVMDFIDSHYTEDLELEKVAASIGFSKYHFSRLFKQYTNYTFCTYLSRRRIKAAQEYLEKADLSITEIALQSGFPSISTFNRAFKQFNNCTPSEYREKIQIYMSRQND